ncbi:MAG: hypothetical protein L3K18_09470 [Thermoplasmata archaeon]|nr:hypothetical protein [Thermoplasmata archaeon]
MTARWIWAVGCHPWSFAHPEEARWRLLPEDGEIYVDYLRAKTYKHTHLLLDPAVRPWAAQFVAEEAGYSEREYLRRTARFGKKIHLDGLTCRALRHDRIFLTLRAVDWDMPVVVMMFGTDAGTLMGYAAGERAKTYTASLKARSFC